MIRTLKIVILIYPHFTNALFPSLLGRSVFSEIMDIKNNITSCIENTIPSKGIFFENDENNNNYLAPEEITRNRKDVKTIVKFLLYTPESNGTYEFLKFNDTVTLEMSNFNKKRPTRFITHGFLSSAAGPSCQLIREAYLNFTNCNVIVIDWSELALEFYPIAAFYVKLVGDYVGSMITFLETMGMNASTTTLVGHSLGAHVMGIAGSAALEKVKYIYGLDPAMPCFLNAETGSRISPDDAEYVEVIHTSIFGDNQTIGDYDFYPNGGVNQPKCSCNLVTESVCSHSSAFEYFAESLNKTKPLFYSVLCKNLDAFKANKCETYEAIMGGIDQTPKRKGHYFLYTKAESPYALGKSAKDVRCSSSKFAMCLYSIINHIFNIQLC